MVSDGWVQVTAAYNSIIICIYQYGMVKIALQLYDKMIGKGLLLDSVSFAAMLHGICLEGISKEWKNIISCTLNEHELQYLPRGRSSEALLILEALIEDYKSNDQQAKVLGG